MTKPNSETAGSRLYYFGSTDEVQLGDRVTIKLWCLPEKIGIVSYIPGLCEADPE